MCNSLFLLYLMQSDSRSGLLAVCLLFVLSVSNFVLSLSPCFRVFVRKYTRTHIISQHHNDTDERLSEAMDNLNSFRAFKQFSVVALVAVAVWLFLKKGNNDAVVQTKRAQTRKAVTSVPSRIQKTTQNVKLKPASSTLSSHPLGVSTSFIRHFIEENKDTLSGMSTTDVCAKLIMLATAGRKCAFIDLLEGQFDAQGKPFAGPATVFVSHAWGSKTLDVFATMLDFADKDVDGGDGEVFFWFDAFCNNQHDIGSKPFGWFCSTFKDGIASIGIVLQVMTPWDDPAPLKRAWCLWETFCALEMAESKGTQLVIRLPPNQRQAFLEGISEDFDVVTDALVRIQARRAEAFKPEDRDNIFRAIVESVGFDKVNEKVKNQLREWYLAMAVEWQRSMEVKT